ncbi:hypothetical protein CGZ93_11150 [Enemella dayhoffiae]|uniref:Lipoprotein n=1 Tax=Enemella dayhoffiae TaxID=2016507 RepID=A0A255GYV4_9ACTN|nr:lipoprotein LpqH [Enemella dayhoffiae]OYO20787.1 hypothetical protein CGZ93_11150 [Enemella dayhoffiae]
MTTPLFRRLGRALPVSVLAFGLLSGCSLINGGSGQFEVEGETYQASSIKCERKEGGILITMDSGPAQTQVGVTEDQQPKVVGVVMGAKGQPTMMMRAQDNTGRAVVSRSANTFLVSGTLVRVAEGKPAGGTEEFKITVSCNKIE